MHQGSTCRYNTKSPLTTPATGTLLVWVTVPVYIDTGGDTHTGVEEALTVARWTRVEVEVGYCSSNTNSPLASLIEEDSQQ